MEDKKIKLRPVVYTTNYFKRGYQNTSQQMFLLKALQVTQDPKKLRQLIGVKTVAEVYRTLDKLAMRKEYHETLSKLGISFDYIAGGIKNIADNGYKDADKLKALQTLLKSVGMDEYKESDGGNSGTWEEELLKAKEIESQKEKDGILKIAAPVQYEVVQPEIPASAKQAMDDEDELTSSIYESKK